MRSHRFINSPLYLIIQFVVKESRAEENNGRIRCFFVLFIDKRYISQVIHFKHFLRHRGYELPFCIISVSMICAVLSILDVR